VFRHEFITRQKKFGETLGWLANDHKFITRMIRTSSKCGTETNAENLVDFRAVVEGKENPRRYDD